MTKSTTLTQVDLERKQATIELELRNVITQRVAGNIEPTATAIKRLFIEIFGEKRSSRDRVQYLLFAAPIMRRLTIEIGREGHASGTINLNAIELDTWLERLRGFDPECAQMIDLRYFAGLSARETARALGVTPQVVIRDLRFAKAWLQARVRWASGTTAAS